MIQKIVAIFFLIIFFFSVSNSVISVAQVMDSNNYSIQSDSVNFGGGLSSSNNFTLESTAGEIATGPSSSASYNLKAGYQQMHEVYLSMTSPADVNLTPSMNGLIANASTGSTAVTVTTDSFAGYELYIKASSSPALVSGANSFPDYTPAGANPDFAFSVSSGTSAFGFTPEGSDVVQKYLDNGSSCNTGATNTSDRCWEGLSTSNELIASKTSGNHPSGTSITIKFRAENGASNVQPAGTYQATTTLTLIAL